MSDNNQKVAVITGGSRGIGRAIAVELAKHGYFIAFTYRSNDAAAEESLEMIKAAGGNGEHAKFDVTDTGAAQDFIDGLTSRFESIDVLVNNAGITRDGLFVMMDDGQWNDVIDTALKGFYNMTRPVLKKMIRKKRGSVITVSSVSGLTGNRGQANYSAAKAGLIGASRSVATEVARLGIRMNVVAPGLINTEMISGAPVDQIKQVIPMARIGEPEEVAKVVRFLCSDDASYITGQVIAINGGMF